MGRIDNLDIKNPDRSEVAYGKTASLHNLGCKVNAYETEAMREMLVGDGYEIVPFGKPADVCVINTCSVTAMADSKSRQMLHRARAASPEGIVIAAGCYVQTGEEVLSLDPEVDILLGQNCRSQLLFAIRRFAAELAKTAESESIVSAHKVAQGMQFTHRPHRPLLIVRPPEDAPWEYEDLHITRSGEHTRAFVKVQDGCNQFCSYCIIPYARGRIRSRTAEDVLDELRTLADSGCREVVFSGIHISSYDGAANLPVQKSHPLVSLLSAASEIPGIERIRLSSLEPRMITPAVAEELSKIKGLCPHFHLSLQSGCDSVLKRMNRHYTTAEFAESVALLRKFFDRPAITTDIIVGFPGETEENFATTEAFVRRIGFYETHVFAYSPRPGTVAAKLSDAVPAKEKKRRSHVLLALNEQQSAGFRASFLGETRPVLFEQIQIIGGRRYFLGYTPEYIRCALPDEGEDLRGVIRTGMLTEEESLKPKADSPGPKEQIFLLKSADESGMMTL